MKYQYLPKLGKLLVSLSVISEEGIFVLKSLPNQIHQEMFYIPKIQCYAKYYEIHTDAYFSTRGRNTGSDKSALSEGS